jgi:hypothetical protein
MNLSISGWTLKSCGGNSAERLGAAVAAAAGPDAALGLIQGHLLRTFRCEGYPDPVIREAVLRLMPWHPVEIGAVAEHLAISTTQL